MNNQIASGVSENGVSLLTGLYEDSEFFKKAAEFLRRGAVGEYCMAAIDIEHFRLFNKWYGRDEGDRFLAGIGAVLKSVQDRGEGVAGYLGCDDFAALLPNRPELFDELITRIMAGVRHLGNSTGFRPAIGVYVIRETRIGMVTMYDRAAIAQTHVMGNFVSRVCYYNDSMVEKLEEELLLVSEVKRALENREFTFYAQPQCDITTGKIVGAESLVRWKHPSKGLIAPGVFIPVLEKNGFIGDLDRYVWEEVCKWLRSWIDRGHSPVPFSVNVSRVDIFLMDVTKCLTGLVKKYGLEPELLKIEITESAYAENDKTINKTVRELQEAGFLVMMDDFGSGYSSMNMLRNIKIDVIKIDMKFLDISETNTAKGIGILESVVNMSRQLGLPIIVEGVETKGQEEFLSGMGCRYTQGFYYYKPLSVQDLETLLADDQRLDHNGMWNKQVESFHIREFFDSNVFSDTMVNNMLGAAAFYDVCGDMVEITRVNEQYFRLTGISAGSEADYSRKIWNHVRDDDRTKLLRIFDQAYEDRVGGGSGTVHYVRADGQILWVYFRTYFLREQEGHRIFYGSLIDISSIRQK